MKDWIKQHGKQILGISMLVIVVAVFIVALTIKPKGSERYFSGEAEVYYRGLLAEGFPEDYAVSLTELHMLHPTWSFTPLKITEAEPSYTWRYVIDKETEKSDLNVVYSSDTYAPYQHTYNKELYDSGYYQASRNTVEYFMDPRNFLNETDIFQFYALSGGTDASLSSIEAVLAGTFMENATLENGKSYAEYFLELGQITNVNPIFLAAKVRNEQGNNGTSPIISGACGDILWNFYDNNIQKTESGSEVLSPADGYDEGTLRALNGYYNHFNVGATGTGLFEIYRKAMERAAKGTPELAAEWNGDAAWNTRWKALYGGAYFLQTKYVGNYQSTVYLQKFNVDSRATDNFRKQYMTSVVGAMSEGRTLYQSFAALDMLDAPANFLIPIYDKMPDSPCKDPANGSVKNFAVATKRYSYTVNLASPERYTTENSPIYLETEVYPNGSLALGGNLSHDYEIEEIQYAWDFGTWQTADDGKFFDLSISNTFPVNSSHILTVRGKATYQTSSKGSDQTIHTTFLAAVIYVNVVPIPKASLSIDVGGSINTLVYDVGTNLRLPACNDVGFAGWYGSDDSFLPSGAALTLLDDVTYSAIFLDFDALSGASLQVNESPVLRFSAVMNPESYNQLTTNERTLLTLSANVTAGDQTNTLPLQISTIAHQSGEQWMRMDVLTDAIEPADFSLSHNPQFIATLHYTDGTQQSITTATPSATRSAQQVAQAALADTGAGYSPEMLAFLQTVAQPL